MNTNHVFDGGIADHIKSIDLSEVDITFSSEYPPYLVSGFYCKVPVDAITGEASSPVDQKNHPKNLDEPKNLELFSPETDLKIAKKVLVLAAELFMRVLSLAELIDSIINNKTFLPALANSLSVLYEDELYVARKTFATMVDNCNNLEEVNLLAIHLDCIIPGEWIHINECLNSDSLRKSELTIPIFDIHNMIKEDIGMFLSEKYLSRYLAGFKVSF
jgi:hypothetical protein